MTDATTSLFQLYENLKKQYVIYIAKHNILAPITMHMYLLHKISWTGTNKNTLIRSSLKLGSSPSSYHVSETYNGDNRSELLIQSYPPNWNIHYWMKYSLPLAQLYQRAIWKKSYELCKLVIRKSEEATVWRYNKPYLAMKERGKLLCR